MGDVLDLTNYTAKYQRLKSEFDEKFKKAGEAFMRKNINN